MAETHALSTIRRQLRLTRAGLWAERITRTFWPAWTILLLAVAIWGAGLVPPLWEGSLLIALAVLALAVALLGLRAFQAPTRADAERRLDATLAGRPIATLTDALSVGAGDAGSSAVWEAHRRRLAARLDDARAVAPDLRVSRRDPYALRYMAVLLAAIALLFGTLLRVPAAPVIPGQGGEAIAAGPAWEGWLQPPRHTGQPTLYLNDIAPGPLDVPEGTRVTLRLYGEPGALTVSETVSGRAETRPAEPIQEFDIARSGTLAIGGAADAPIWSLSVAPDAAPTVALSGPPDFEHPETMTMPWEARDDHGIVAATVTLALNPDAVERRYGLSVEPEPVEAIERDMSLPIAGGRDDVAETFRADLTKHALSGLPVTATLTVEDAPGQSGSFVADFVLPPKPFYDPVAAALIEMRRDLLWSRENRARVVQVLRAISWKGDDTFDNPSAYLIVRSAARRLDAARPLEPGLRDEIAEMLWQAAVRLEESSLDSARERLEQAQERLSEAIRNGAPPEEIERLMAEMRRAMDDYTRQLAQQQGEQTDPGQQQAQGDMQEVTPDMLDQMMQRIEELMEQGRVAEAQELLRQLQEMMENLQVTQGQPGQGEGQQGEGQQAMDDLRDTLRDQQGLSDDAFRELQEQFNPNAQSGQSQQNEGSSGSQGRGTEHSQGQGEQGERQEGEQQGAGEGQTQGQPGGGTSPSELARRQSELRGQLGELRDNLPRTGGEAGERAAEALDRAGRAMDEAERDLDRGNLGGALDDQAQAMDALRDGMQELGRAMAEDRPEGQPGEGRQGQAAERAGDGFRRDPLGRRSGEGARLGTDEQFLGELDATRRSRELMDEIRRRSGERQRPEIELDYLRRLLDRF